MNAQRLMSYNWSINGTSFVFLPDPTEHEKLLLLKGEDFN